MVFSCLLFPPGLDVIENAFARDLGGIIQQYMRHRLGASNRDHDPISKR